MKHNKEEQYKSHNGTDHPDHQDVIVSEKLKLLKISSLKAEQKQDKLLSVSFIQMLDSLVLQ